MEGRIGKKGSNVERERDMRPTSRGSARGMMI